MHLDAGANAAGEPLGRPGLGTEEARLEAENLRSSASYLLVVADKLESEARLAERLDALRNVEGRTPEEAAMFLAKADEIEAAARDQKGAPGDGR